MPRIHTSLSSHLISHHSFNLWFYALTIFTCSQVWNMPCWFQPQGLCMSHPLYVLCFLSICAILAHSMSFRTTLKMTFSETPSKVVSSIISFCSNLCLALIYTLFSYELISYCLATWGCTLHEEVPCLLQGVGQPLAHRGNPLNICWTIDWLKEQLMDILYGTCFLGLAQIRCWKFGLKSI